MIEIIIVIPKMKNYRKVQFSTSSNIRLFRFFVYLIKKLLAFQIFANSFEYVVIFGKKRFTKFYRFARNYFNDFNSINKNLQIKRNTVYATIDNWLSQKQNNYIIL